MWRSTVSPMLRFWATLSFGAYCSAILRSSFPGSFVFGFSTWFAPGHTSGPFRMHARSFSMLWSMTFSGNVMIFATCRGTPTCVISRFGSGEMTVRAEKSTRFPDKLPRKRPLLPFRRWHRPRIWKRALKR
jgi:hypothetical protein